MTWFETLSTISSFVVIIGGACWTYKTYIQQRQKYPKARLSQDVQAIRLNEDKSCIHTCVTIENTGAVLLKIESVRNYVYQVLPLSGEMQTRLTTGDDLYDQTGQELLWPSLDDRETMHTQMEIEPGETDTIQFDSVISSAVEAIQVYTYFKNVSKRDKEIGWNTWKTYDISAIQRFGGVQCLQNSKNRSHHRKR